LNDIASTAYLAFLGEPKELERDLPRALSCFVYFGRVSEKLEGP
jgi:hypothetical protein